MGISFWIWLAVVVISFLVRANKKKPQEQLPDTREDTGSQRPEFNPKPVTFEELLKEIQASKVPAPQPVLPRKTEYIDYDDDLEKEEDLEQTDYTYRNEDSIYQTYEKAKQDAFVKPSLEETLKLKDTDMTFGQFKGYQQAEQKNHGAEILKDFHDPEGFKKAFIMSEIMKTKF
jgi:hypothetical protein